ncbi:MAG: hypothetical protein AB7V77_01715 [Candidatus Woesearchaeota archaeon]
MTEENSAKSGWITFIVIVLFIIATSFFTSQSQETRSAFDDTNAFFKIFESAANNDIEGVFDSIEDAVIFLALFILIFSLLYFLFTAHLKHIFKSKRFAFILSAVITIYCFVDNRVYNYIANLSAYAIGFMVFIVVVMILWGSSKTMYNNGKNL